MMHSRRAPSFSLRAFFPRAFSSSTRRGLLWCALACIIAMLGATALRAEIRDPLDPFDIAPSTNSEKDDNLKTPDELIREAQLLLEDERLLDARTKLLRALQKEPTAYRAHVMLAGYYLVHVGHFRLALKYAKQAHALFEKRNGPPPYTDVLTRSEHGQMLYLLSQIRLDLDNYQGALEVLDEYQKYGYFSPWYPASRAWVLMKLGRIEDAIREARIGVLASEDRGRTLNMLGILLSMHGERESSLAIFRQAIADEMSLGKEGQPATPLNNSGEVYKEIFQEDKAEGAWLRATSLPDGCEHVLPSLNLALLYIDQMNFQGAKKAMDSFESCVAQYPLRNGEEHRALVRLARGRIALYTGHIPEAIKLLGEALEERQWFGKIGTTEHDMQSATMITLGAALAAANNLDSFVIPSSLWERLSSFKTSLERSMQRWWLLRRARQLLSSKPRGFEDLYVRNTDSLIEYPTFGTALRGFPATALATRIALEQKNDTRPEAGPYYRAYMAERLLESGDIQAGINEIFAVLKGARARYDDLLRIHIILLLLSHLDPHAEQYRRYAYDVFISSRAMLRNAGLRLPVNVKGDSQELIEALANSAFLLDNEIPLDFEIIARLDEKAYSLEFVAKNNSLGSIRVKGNNLREAVNKFADEVFSMELR